MLVTIGKSRGERRVIFFLSGAIRKEAPVEALGAEETKIGGRGSYRNSRRARRSMQRERRRVLRLISNAISIWATFAMIQAESWYTGVPVFGPVNKQSFYFFAV